MLWVLDPETTSALRTADATGTLAVRRQAAFAVLAAAFPTSTKLRVNKLNADGSVGLLVMEATLNTALRQRAGIAYFPLATYVVATLATAPGDLLRVALSASLTSPTPRETYAIAQSTSRTGDGNDASTARLSTNFQSRTGSVAIGPIVFELPQI